MCGVYVCFCGVYVSVWCVCVYMLEKEKEKMKESLCECECKHQLCVYVKMFVKVCKRVCLYVNASDCKCS